MKDSRIKGLYRLGVAERIGELQRRGFISRDDAAALAAGRQVISAAAADKIIENVIGVFGLPLAIAPNFIVNGRETLVPLVVEEPSIVAALSHAASLARGSGGFRAAIDESLLIGQIHVAGIPDTAAAINALGAASETLTALATAAIPGMVNRGGGVRGIEFLEHELPGGARVVAVHLLVDTCDAMGANTVNTLSEALAPEVAAICGGDVALRILSNLADRSICTATVTYPLTSLESDLMDGAAVRDRIVLANDIALVDPHRAATHNKGIMNGIDPLAIATGNDWRAIEAGAHAFAARSGRYAALTSWKVGADGSLSGEIQLPLKPGTVGGTLTSNPAAALGLAIAGVDSAMELAELMAAVGLAQNFAALKALATSGIQKGHMRLHARSVATAAGTPAERLEEVVEKLVASGDFKARKVREILGHEVPPDALAAGQGATAAGKIILLGEHAAVYGRHALAVPIPDAIRARAVVSDGPTTLTVRDWALHHELDTDSDRGVDGIVNCILARLGVAGERFAIAVTTSLPAGMGLGSSAALAVAITRAVALCVEQDIDDDEVNAVAFDCEKLSHGTPSGIDNALSCYGRPMLYKKDESLDIEQLSLGESPPLLIAYGKLAGSTEQQVAGVRARYQRDPAGYTAIFDQIDGISLVGKEALVAGDYEKLGALMNLCHGLLNAIEVSTPDLENMVAIAREHGALGAKLTGAGGGGSIVALCPEGLDVVASALQQSGYSIMRLPQEQ